MTGKTILTVGVVATLGSACAGPLTYQHNSSLGSFFAITFAVGVILWVLGALMGS